MNPNRRKANPQNRSTYFPAFLAILTLLTVIAIPATVAAYQSCSPPPDPCVNPDQECLGSPILIDTKSEGFHLTSLETGVTFDISGGGHPVQIAWTDQHSSNAFLALPGPDGLVHNGKELFGNFTPQPQSPHPNGFLALAEFDKPQSGGNGDGVIDKSDSVFPRLRLWIDENHDGVCQPNELHTLPELGVSSIALKYRESRRIDRYGNEFRYRGRINVTDQQEDSSPTDPIAYDVFLVIAGQN
jgi:hypothetical protein